MNYQKLRLFFFLKKKLKVRRRLKLLLYKKIYFSKNRFSVKIYKNRKLNFLYLHFLFFRYSLYCVHSPKTFKTLTSYSLEYFANDIAEFKVDFTVPTFC